MVTVNWTTLKSIIDNSSQNPTCCEDEAYYHIYAANEDGIIFTTDINKNSTDTTDLNDFVNNYLPDCRLNNPNSVGVLKAIREKIQTNQSGYAELLFLIPGANFKKKARIFSHALVWFVAPQEGDYIIIDVVDHDNITGQGVDTVLKTYYDEDYTSGNHGYYIPKASPVLRIENIEGLGLLTGGTYLRVRVQTGDQRQDWFYGNISWGESC